MGCVARKAVTTDRKVAFCTARAADCLCKMGAAHAQKAIMVEAAGVEPDNSIENTQLTDSGKAGNSSNSTIARSCGQSES